MRPGAESSEAQLPHRVADAGLDLLVGQAALTEPLADLVEAVIGTYEPSTGADGWSGRGMGSAFGCASRWIRSCKPEGRTWSPSMAPSRTTCHLRPSGIELPGITTKPRPPTRVSIGTPPS